MSRKVPKRIQSEQGGFTLIELLVVIAVIAILAALAIPTFLGQREKAQDSEAKTAVHAAASAAKSYYVDKDTYVGIDVALLKKTEPSLGHGQGATLAISGIGDDTYVLDVTSESGNHFKISESAGVITRTCTVGGDAGCPADGGW